MGGVSFFKRKYIFRQTILTLGRFFFFSKILGRTTNWTYLFPGFISGQAARSQNDEKSKNTLWGGDNVRPIFPRTQNQILVNPFSPHRQTGETTIRVTLSFPKRRFSNEQLNQDHENRTILCGGNSSGPTFIFEFVEKPFCLLQRKLFTQTRYNLVLRAGGYIKGMLLFPKARQQAAGFESTKTERYSVEIFLGPSASQFDDLRLSLSSQSHHSPHHRGLTTHQPSWPVGWDFWLSNTCFCKHKLSQYIGFRTLLNPRLHPQATRLCQPLETSLQEPLKRVTRNLQSFIPWIHWLGAVEKRE